MSEPGHKHVKFQSERWLGLMTPSFQFGPLMLHLVLMYLSHNGLRIIDFNAPVWPVFSYLKFKYCEKAAKFESIF